MRIVQKLYCLIKVKIKINFKFKEKLHKFFLDVSTVCEEKFQMLVELRHVSIKQKEKIKDLQQNIDNYCCEIENLHVKKKYF